MNIKTKTGITPLHLAARRNNDEAIKTLVDKADEMSIEDFVNIRDFEFKNTPLFEAYTHRSKEAVIALLELKANPLLESKLSVSVKERAYQESKQGSADFAQFVLDEIEKYPPPPNHCTRPLVK